jgi:hypothetical protein
MALQSSNCVAYLSIASDVHSEPDYSTPACSPFKHCLWPYLSIRTYDDLVDYFVTKTVFQRELYWESQHFSVRLETQKCGRLANGILCLVYRLVK